MLGVLKKDRLFKFYPDRCSTRSFDLKNGMEKIFLKSDQVYHLRISLEDNYGKCIELGNSPNVKLWFLTCSSYCGGVNSKFFVYVYYPT